MMDGDTAAHYTRLYQRPSKIFDCTPAASSLARIITEDSHTNSTQVTQLRIHLQRDTDKCIPRTFEGVRHNNTTLELI